jgi:hypothetical protein
MHIRYLLENQNEREDEYVSGWTILKWLLEGYNVMVRTGSNWLRIETSGRLL